MRSACSVVAAVAALTVPAAAQESTASGNPATMVARSTSTAPDIDGRLDDDAWLDAPVATAFVQYEPDRGAASPHRTEARVLYDEEHLYVAFRVWDDEEPSAQLTRRDADVMEDDAFVLLLDSHHDRQSAYLFGTNLLGTQTDGRVANDGRTVDRDWDGTWITASARTEDGWSAEMAIPFATIKYRAGADVSWGINFGRTRRRSLETAFWTGPLDAEFRVSQAGVLSGLHVSAPARRHRVVPYVLGTASDGRAPDGDVGIDARYELTPSISAVATVNPDFATIEADQERINLTRFELSQPEKRQFFMEGNELFRQRIRTFYSRRVSDLSVGAKLLGREGAWNFAALYATAPPAGESQNAGYGVLRLQRDLGRSSVAVTAADRGFDGRHQGSVGLDTTLFFSDTLGLTAQLIQSYGDHTEGTTAWFLRPSYDSPTTHFHVRYTHLGERFADNVNAVGFIRDDDRRELDSAFEKTFWPQGGPFERFQYDSNYNIYWSQSGPLRSWQVDQSIEIDLRNRFAVELSHTEEFKRFEKDFRNRQSSLELGYNTRQFESVTLGYSVGRNFDSDFTLWSIEGATKVTEGLSIEYELQRLSLEPDPDDASTWIHVIRANQFFTPDLFLKVFVQTNSAIDRRNLQAVFVYRYAPPFGTLQLAYQRGTAEFGARSEQGNTLFLKATSVF